MDSIRTGARGLLRRPSYLAALVVLLGAGCGVTTAAFAIYDAVLLRPLPYSRADRLFVLSEVGRTPGSATTPASSATSYFYWREHATTLAGIGAVWALPRGLFATIEGRSEVLSRATVSPDMFSVLGVDPAIGTTGSGFVISGSYWRRRFGNDPSVLGKLVVLEGGRGLEPVPIAGVMAADVNIPAGVDVWSVGREPEYPTTSARRAERRLIVIGRLRPGTSERQMRSELETLESQLAASYPDTHAGWGVKVTDLRTYLAGPSRHTAVALQVTTVFVLVVILINSALLMLARAESLGRGDLLRVALGATLKHFSFAVAAEWSVVLVATAAVGIGAAGVASRLLARQAELYLPFVDRAAIDAHAIVYLLLLVSTVCATLAALELAHRYRAASSRLDLRRELGVSVLSRRSMSALLVLEVSLGVLLVSGAIRLMGEVRVFSAAASTVDASGVLAVRVRQPIVWSGDRDNAYPTGRFVSTNTALLDAVERIPGVVAVAAVRYSALCWLGECDVALLVCAGHGQLRAAWTRCRQIGSRRKDHQSELFQNPGNSIACRTRLRRRGYALRPHGTPRWHEPPRGCDCQPGIRRIRMAWRDRRGSDDHAWRRFRRRAGRDRRDRRRRCPQSCEPGPDGSDRLRAVFPESIRRRLCAGEDGRTWSVGGGRSACACSIGRSCSGCRCAVICEHHRGRHRARPVHSASRRHFCDHGDHDCRARHVFGRQPDFRKTSDGAGGEGSAWGNVSAHSVDRTATDGLGVDPGRGHRRTGCRGF